MNLKETASGSNLDEMIEDLEIFLKEVFCIDGKCETLFIKNIIYSGPCFKLTDSARGEFYVVLLRKDDIEQNKKEIDGKDK